MPPQHSRRQIISVLHALSTTLVLTSVGAARAESNPFYVGANLSLAHDSNVFRRPDAVADTSYSAGLLGGIDQPIGRQRMYASGRLRDTRYQDLKQLDNTGYSVNAGLEWETVEKLSGTLSYSANESLFNFGGTNITQSTARNIERSNEALARVKYGASSLLAVEGSYTRRSLRYSDPRYQANGLTQDAVGAGLVYRPSAALKLGAGLRITRGQYEGSGQDFDRRDVDLTATWVATGLSTFDGRFSLGRRETRGGRSELDFSGATGQLSWTYQPTGKLQFKTSFSRDSGAESGFIDFNAPQAGSVGDSSKITNAITLNAAYVLSSKIRVGAGLRANHRSLVSGAVEGSDSVRSATLSVSYAALRNLALSCNVGRETRGASGPLSFGYGASSATCSAEIKLQ
ncbi:MAG: hypothetical protein QFE16_07035 [Pseudomonadota bacterium]|nr:hypothetical protein [Pseudomonadota bacterium]